MATLVTAFQPYIAPFALGAPTPMLDRAVLFACARFCDESGLIQDTSVQSFRAGSAEYDVDALSETRLSGILGVWVDDRELAAVATDDVHVARALRDPSAADAGTPSCFFQREPTAASVTLFPMPDAGGLLTIRASFAPTLTATSVPDILFTEHLYTIVDGAASYLLNIPGMPFTNQAQSAALGARFSSSVIASKAVARAGNIRRSMRVSPRPFA